jgi:hypothetical protein
MKGKIGRVYYSMAEVGQMTGKSTDAARKWLQRLGACRKLGGRWVTTTSQLAAAFPEAFQAFAR